MSDHAPHGGGRHRAGRAGTPRTTAAMAAMAAALVAPALGSVLAAPAQAADDAASAAAAPQESPAARAAHAEPLVPGTPCSISAKACVDLETDRAWLIQDGRVIRGPMQVTTGAKGYETPIGHSFRVYRHDADHVSKESRLPDGRPAPMPYSTFFADGGVAFHGGSLERASAGCVHMSTADARATYDYLQNGDKVQVVKGSEELAARAAR